MVVLLAAPAAAAVPGACATLAGQVAAEPAGPVFLASYPTVTAGPLHRAAFLYDNAAAALALVGCGRPELARRVGDALLAAQARDRFWHDGRLRNGYAAGPVGDGPVKLSGWWDDTRNQWLEDRYQVGSDSGNLAWATLALLALGPEYRPAAERLASWLEARRDQRGPGGFSGGMFGHEPDPRPIQWKSTEHNTDLAAAFRRLGREAASGAATAFVNAMWDDACRCFATGTGEDGITPNRFLALDAQVWPLLALPGLAAAHGDAVLANLESRLRFGAGYAYSEVRDGLWTEGTAQVALLAGLLGHADLERTLLAAVAAQRTADGATYASASGELPTGFMLDTDPGKPRLYFHVPHLGALAWAALAERRFNPFTGAGGLP